MRKEDALKLKAGDHVWVSYTPNPGHGVAFSAPGKVQGSVTDNPAHDYVWVCVFIPSQLHASVFASKFISKL